MLIYLLTLISLGSNGSESWSGPQLGGITQSRWWIYLTKTCCSSILLKPQRGLKFKCTWKKNQLISRWCINQQNAWLSGVSTWQGAWNCVHWCDLWLILNSKRPGHLLTSALSGTPFYHGFHLWQMPGKTTSCKHSSLPSWCHRSSVPKVRLTLMLLGWKWETRCQVGTWLLMQSGEVSVPQAICGHPCVSHMAHHTSLQRIGKRGLKFIQSPASC